MMHKPEFRETTRETQYGCERVNLLVGDRPGFVILPDGLPGGRPTPWVWYAPTFAGRLPGARHEWLMERVLSAGVAVCGVDIGESCGNPEGRRAFSDFYGAVIEHYGLDGRARLLAQSRGGLMLYNWALECPGAVDRIAGIYPVCNLASWPGLDKACGAYGLTTGQLAAELSCHNPIDRLVPLALADVPIFHIHGDADEVVPLEHNSAELARRYGELGGRVELAVVPGEGHHEVDAFFTSQRRLDFLLAGH